MIALGRTPALTSATASVVSPNPAPSQFTGSEQWHRHGLVRDVLFTDGAKYVADAGGAYRLLDEIALAQRSSKRVAGEEFQLWKLTVKADKTATLTCDDGNGNAPTASSTGRPRLGGLYLCSPDPRAERALVLL
jgi:hypothetical protein